MRAAVCFSRIARIQTVSCWPLLAFAFRRCTALVSRSKASAAGIMATVRLTTRSFTTAKHLHRQCAMVHTCFWGCSDPLEDVKHIEVQEGVSEHLALLSGKLESIFKETSTGNQQCDKSNECLLIVFCVHHAASARISSKGISCDALHIHADDCLNHHLSKRPSSWLCSPWLSSTDNVSSWPAPIAG